MSDHGHMSLKMGNAYGKYMHLPIHEITVTNKCLPETLWIFIFYFSWKELVQISASFDQNNSVYWVKLVFYQDQWIKLFGTNYDET